MLALLSKLVLLRRYSRRARNNYRLALEPNTLLPTQAQDLERLTALIRAQDLEEPARIVQVEGRWGEGKSFLLRRLGNQLDREDPGTNAVAYMSVWQHQSEPSIHFSLFEELLATPCYLRGGAWLLYPVALLAGKSSIGLDGAITRLSWRSRSGTAVELPMSLPTLPWQSQLERMIARQRRHGRRTVIVVDEIDRAAPIVVQSTLTLAMRSLDLAGTVVVLSTVGSILRYKAFNPSISEMLPDLSSTMEAMLYISQFESNEPLLGTRPAKRTPYQWWASEAPASESNPDPRPYLKDMGLRLRRGFEGAEQGTRRRLQDQIEERYLGRSSIILHRLTNDDIAQVPFTFQTLRKLTLKVADIDATGGEAKKSEAINEAIKLIRSGLESLGTDSPPIRAFEAQLETILSELEHRLGETKGDRALLAAAVEFAYVRASKRVRLMT